MNFSKNKKGAYKSQIQIKIKFQIKKRTKYAFVGGQPIDSPQTPPKVISVMKN